MDMARETHHRPSEEKLRHHQFMDVRTLTLTTLLMLRRSFRFWSRDVCVVDKIRVPRRARKGVFWSETIERGRGLCWAVSRSSQVCNLAFQSIFVRLKKQKPPSIHGKMGERSACGRDWGQWLKRDLQFFWSAPQRRRIFSWIEAQFCLRPGSNMD